MNIDVQLNLNPSMLAPFRTAWEEASRKAAHLSPASLAEMAAFDPAHVPEELRRHIARVSDIADLLADEQWQTDAQTRQGLAGALVYFADADDLIPDAEPRFGLLDDAIVIELALACHDREWLTWQEFRAFQRGHAELGPIDRETWLRLRREAAERRSGEASYVNRRFDESHGRSTYRMLDALPRLDLH